MARHASTEAVLRWFEYEHLHEPLRSISASCAALADEMATMLEDSPHGAEVTTGLRKLLESKDCFVRAALPPNRPPAPPGP